MPEFGLLALPPLGLEERVMLSNFFIQTIHFELRNVQMQQLLYCIQKKIFDDLKLFMVLFLFYCFALF